MSVYSVLRLLSQFICIIYVVSSDNSTNVETELINTNQTLAEEVVEIDKNSITIQNNEDVEYSDDTDDASNNLCPNNEGTISDQARRAVVDYHNRMRSRLAKGLQRDKRALYAPKAANMLKMVYDCDIEMSAQEWANECKHSHTPPNQRRDKDIGENLAWIPFNRTDVEYLTFSSYLWWREVETIGIGNDTVFMYDFLKEGVGHYTQMAWQKSFRLGCGMKQCSNEVNNRMYVVCQYNPRGNGPEGRHIYKTGEPCQEDWECPREARCLRSEALCQLSEKEYRSRRRV